MKLSEAIRLEGLTGSPQGFDGWMDDVTRCALAGAADSAGIVPEWNSHQERWGVPYDGLQEMFPVMLAKAAACPLCEASHPKMRVMDVVVHLNDFHRSNRERIADYVQSVESEQSSAGENTQAQDAVACPVRTQAV